jgi:predicted DNA-binding transcriptional regulator AlpA
VTTPVQLPAPGNPPPEAFLRASQIVGDRQRGLAPLVPVSKTCLWQWVKAGKFPQPIKLADNVTVWKASDVYGWLESHGA